MWRPATKQITGTNDSAFILILASCHSIYIPIIVPLGGNRRRFGPAPVEESAPPQLAQPSPSAYPRPRDDGSRAKEESASTGTPVPGKSTVTYLLRCIVRIGDSITLHYS
jgi:splicing factor 1